MQAVMEFKKGSRHAKRWTDKEDLKLSRLIGEGKAPQEIADELGRTAVACYQRRLKLGLPPGVHPLHSTYPYHAYRKQKPRKNVRKWSLLWGLLTWEQKMP